MTSWTAHGGARWRALVRSDAARFLVAGGLNTLASYALYAVLLQVLPYLAAYTVAYVAGIVSGYVLTARYVFRQPLSLRRFLTYPLVHVIQYALGSLVLWTCVQVLGLDRLIAFAAATCLSVPVTFVVSRRLLVGPTGPAEPAEPIDLTESPEPVRTAPERG